MASTSSSREVPRQAFGSTGHESSRVLFGAAAFAGMRQERCDQVMEMLLEFGVNHLDTAAAYGESELRLRPWMQTHRDDFFLATKTGNRSYQGARDCLHRSLQRLGVDYVDLLQLHHLVDKEHWERALGEGGALEAAVEARNQGLVRFIGVTGHGTQVAKRHLESLQRFAFDSVLLPYSPAMMLQDQYKRDFEALLAECKAKGVAVQTIKAVAKRRWRSAEERKFSWYEPIMDASALSLAVNFVLQREGLFLNSSSDTRILRATLEAASQPLTALSEEDLRAWTRDNDVEPLFSPGRYEEVGLA